MTEKSDDAVERLQALLAALEGVSDPTAKLAARELVQVALDLHRSGLTDLVALVREAGSQPADTLLPRFAANPRVRSLLLLHDLHPQDLATRARQAVDGLRPHLGVKGARAALAGVEDGVVRIHISAQGEFSRPPYAAVLRREVEEAVAELTPDAAELVIEGPEADAGSEEMPQPLLWVPEATTRAGN